MNDCNETVNGKGLRSRFVGLIFWGIVGAVAPAAGSVAGSDLPGGPQHGQSAAETGQPDGADTPPPELSLRTLFHPQDKYRYVEPLQRTHWIAGDSGSELLVRGEDSWQRFDTQDASLSPWPVVDRLEARLGALDGLKEGQARSAALDVVPQLQRSDDRVVAKIAGALAVVSSQTPARWLTRDGTAWGNVTLDPPGRRVAYTREGDLFVLDVASGRTLRMTRDASDTLLDGVLDWTYQEEIFGRGNYKGFWFSPDGNWLAMLRIDISGIEPYTLAAASSERGAGVVRRYPKAGDPIPHANLLLWDLREFDRGGVPPPQLLARSTPQTERIVTGVWWHPEKNSLLYCLSDRKQTWRELRRLDDPQLAGRPDSTILLLREESPTWVEPPTAPGWLADGGLVWRSELPSGRYRLYHLSDDGSVVTPMTPEGFDVHDFFVRSDGAFAIVTGDANGHTYYRHAYRLPLREGTAPRLVPLTSEEGWHATKISPDGEFVVDAFSTPTEPPELRVGPTGGGPVQPIDQSPLKLTSDMIKPEIFGIPNGAGIELPAMIIRPEKASADRPCPVVVEVYGGPQAPVVSSRWGGAKTLYRELLARRGIATLVVDNRSSGGRGIADTWSVRGRFGEVELQDLLVAVEWLKQQPWVDSDRVALRGWSFGGFLTLYAMTHSDAFHAGIAGGSVTDWREYDAFYTERYMGLPDENEEGYAATAPVAAAKNLQGRLLMIHGESDDNVHPSGTMRMAAALQRAGIDFRLMIYPGAAHSVHQPGQVWHMVQMTDRFLLETLRPDSDRPQ